jgi:hypothetical protein
VIVTQALRQAQRDPKRPWSSVREALGTAGNRASVIRPAVLQKLYDGELWRMRTSGLLDNPAAIPSFGLPLEPLQ